MEQGRSINRGQVGLNYYVSFQLTVYEAVVSDIRYTKRGRWIAPLHDVGEFLVALALFWKDGSRGLMDFFLLDVDRDSHLSAGNFGAAGA